MTSFPGLHGHAAKSRWAIVIDPRRGNRPDGVLVVPASASSLSEYGVTLPNQEQNPGCKSGLPRRCTAVCDQPKMLETALLTDLRGRLSAVLVNRIIEQTRAYVRASGKVK